MGNVSDLNGLSGKLPYPKVVTSYICILDVLQYFREGNKGINTFVGAKMANVPKERRLDMFKYLLKDCGYEFDLIALNANEKLRYTKLGDVTLYAEPLITALTHKYRTTDPKFITEKMFVEVLS